MLANAEYPAGVFAEMDMVAVKRADHRSAIEAAQRKIGAAVRAIRVEGPNVAAGIRNQYQPLGSDTQRRDRLRQALGEGGMVPTSIVRHE